MSPFEFGIDAFCSDVIVAPATQPCQALESCDFFDMGQLIRRPAYDMMTTRYILLMQFRRSGPMPWRV